jgi:hypothetical protein
VLKIKDFRFVFAASRLVMQHLRNNSTVFEELEVSIVDLTVANAVLLATRREKKEARQQIDSQ